MKLALETVYQFYTEYEMRYDKKVALLSYGAFTLIEFVMVRLISVLQKKKALISCKYKDTNNYDIFIYSA